MLDTVSYYVFQSEFWFRAPNLNNARFGHSSCALNDMIYVFGGVDNNFNHMARIEILDAHEVVNGYTEWMEIEVNGYLHPRISCLMVPINDAEILIMGGDKGQDGGLNTVQVLNTNMLEVQQVYENEFEFKSCSNQYAITNEGEVTALVSDISEEMLYMVQFKHKI